MQECIFCKIVQKQIPAFIVYEDDLCLAFLDINPLAVGHTLVVPKKHTENIFDIEEKDLEHIAKVAKRIAGKMKESLGAEGVNLFQASGTVAGQSILHFHLHVVPRKADDGVNINEWWTSKARRASKEELEEASKLIRIEALQSVEVKETAQTVEEKVERNEKQVKYIKKLLEMA